MSAEMIVMIVAAVLSVASILLHAIAPRTKNTVDDALASGIDAVVAKLGDLILPILKAHITTEVSKLTPNPAPPQTVVVPPVVETKK